MPPVSSTDITENFAADNGTGELLVTKHRGSQTYEKSIAL
jgi:hypothetical protein